MEKVIEILNNNSLTAEEQTILLKQLVKEIQDKENKQEEKKDEYDSSYDNYNDKQKEIVKKNREQAAGIRERIQERKDEQVAVDEAKRREENINEKIDVLANLKNKNGENQFSREYLEKLSGFELQHTYEDCIEYMPDAMKEAEMALSKKDDSSDSVVKTDSPLVETEIKIPEVKDDIATEEPIKSESNNESIVIPTEPKVEEPKISEPDVTNEENKEPVYTSISDVPGLKVALPTDSPVPIEEKIHNVQEAIGQPLEVVDEPPRDSFKVRKPVFTDQELADREIRRRNNAAKFDRDANNVSREKVSIISVAKDKVLNLFGMKSEKSVEAMRAAYFDDYEEEIEQPDLNVEPEVAPAPTPEPKTETEIMNGLGVAPEPVAPEVVTGINPVPEVAPAPMPEPKTETQIMNGLGMGPVNQEVGAGINPVPEVAPAPMPEPKTETQIMSGLGMGPINQEANNTMQVSGVNSMPTNLEQPINEMASDLSQVPLKTEAEIMNGLGMGPVNSTDPSMNR